MDLTVLPISRTFRRHLKWAVMIAVVLLSPLCAGHDRAVAQVIIATVNNNPITNIDLEQRMKMLRVLKQPATSEAAFESLVDDHVKEDDIKKYAVKPGDAEINNQILDVAKEMKVDPNNLVAELGRAGVSTDHYKAHFATDYAFDLITRAFNKGVEASEIEVRAELAKEGGKSAAGTEYSVRQIILPLPGNAPQATVEARSHLAEQIKTRFTDCATGVPMIQAMDEAVIKNPISRTSLQLGTGLKDVLDKTPMGHVTPPQRTATGIEMLALCSKGAAKDDTTAHDAIAQKLLNARYAKIEADRLKELRSYAVIHKK